jgi:hypothetical protein
MPKPYNTKPHGFEGDEVWEYDYTGRYAKRDERWEPLRELPYEYHHLVPPEARWKHGDPCTNQTSYLTPGALNQILLTWEDDYVDAASRLFGGECYEGKITLIPSVHEFMLGYSEWYATLPDVDEGKHDSLTDYDDSDGHIPRCHVIDDTNHDSKYYMKHLRVMPWTGGPIDTHYLGCGHEDHPAILLMQSSFAVRGSGWKNSYGFTGWCDTLWINARGTLTASESDSDSLRIARSHLAHTLRVKPYDAYPDLEYRQGKPHPKRRSLSYV